jgi:hypothetical protein
MVSDPSTLSELVRLPREPKTPSWKLSTVTAGEKDLVEALAQAPALEDGALLAPREMTRRVEMDLAAAGRTRSTMPYTSRLMPLE